MNKGNFIPLSTIPPLEGESITCPCSVPLLGLNRWRRQVVVVAYQSDEDDPSVITWRESGRDSFDVTDVLIGWQPLPSPYLSTES